MTEQNLKLKALYLNLWNDCFKQPKYSLRRYNTLATEFYLWKNKEGLPMRQMCYDAYIRVCVAEVHK